MNKFLDYSKLLIGSIESSKYSLQEKLKIYCRVMHDFKDAPSGYGVSLCFDILKEYGEILGFSRYVSKFPVLSESVMFLPDETYNIERIRRWATDQTGKGISKYEFELREFINSITCSRYTECDSSYGCKIFPEHLGEIKKVQWFLDKIGYKVSVWDINLFSSKFMDTIDEDHSRFWIDNNYNLHRPVFLHEVHRNL